MSCFNKWQRGLLRGMKKTVFGENLGFWQVLMRSFNVVEIIKIAG